MRQMEINNIMKRSNCVWSLVFLCGIVHAINLHVRILTDTTKSVADQYSDVYSEMSKKGTEYNNELEYLGYNVELRTQIKSTHEQLLVLCPKLQQLREDYEKTASKRLEDAQFIPWFQKVKLKFSELQCSMKISKANEQCQSWLTSSNKAVKEDSENERELAEQKQQVDEVHALISTAESAKSRAALLTSLDQSLGNITTTLSILGHSYKDELAKLVNGQLVEGQLEVMKNLSLKLNQLGVNLSSLELSLGKMTVLTEQDLAKYNKEIAGLKGVINGAGQSVKKWIPSVETVVIPAKISSSPSASTVLLASGGVAAVAGTVTAAVITVEAAKVVEPNSTVEIKPTNEKIQINSTNLIKTDSKEEPTKIENKDEEEEEEEEIEEVVPPS